MSFFRIAFAFDAIFVSVLVYFFLEGLRYPASNSAQGLWLLIIGVPVALMAGAWQLKAHGWAKSANGLLGAVALPPLLYVLFFGMIIILEPTWR
ncbi:MAG TPA: hypothetical protein VF628_10245 [Allosphingosinicella sp.]|jgi:hypothetical protein